MSFNQKKSARMIRKVRIRKKVFGIEQRPRLSVFRSSRYIYAQIIDDVKGNTLVACSSLEKDVKSKLQKLVTKERMKEVGKILAERAKQKKIHRVMFDRNGYLYHGRVKLLAEGAREAGLQF